MLSVFIDSYEPRLRKNWTDSGIIRNLNSIGKLILKVPEAGVI